jgi:hypothetical protein
MILKEVLMSTQLVKILFTLVGNPSLSGAVSQRRLSGL